MKNFLRSLFLIPLFLITATSGGASPAPKSTSLYDFEVKQINGPKSPEASKLSQYSGKVLLIVNTASQCGYTSQYKGLQALYDKYGKDGFVVLGFPSNDFGAQEPGSSTEIKNFCERNYKVSFPLFEKAPVSGNRIQPLYAYLLENAPTKGAVGWNFEKFLVARDGRIVGRYKSGVKPEDSTLIAAIESALKTTK